MGLGLQHGISRRSFIATPVVHDNKCYIAVGQEPDDGSNIGRRQRRGAEIPAEAPIDLQVEQRGRHPRRFDVDGLIVCRPEGCDEAV